ncbi:hypothetical protein KI387_039806, partial [Taxus chinensis]
CTWKRAYQEEERLTEISRSPMERTQKSCAEQEAQEEKKRRKVAWQNYHNKRGGEDRSSGVRSNRVGEVRERRSPQELCRQVSKGDNGGLRQRKRTIRWQQSHEEKEKTKEEICTKRMRRRREKYSGKVDCRRGQERGETRARKRWRREKTHKAKGSVEKP